MTPRDPRPSGESDLRSVEVRGDHVEVAEAPGPQATTIWALYPAVSPAGREPDAGAGTDWIRLVLDVARRGRHFLILGALTGVCLGIAYLTIADAIYVVKAVLHVELRRSVIRESDARPGSGYVATQAEVIQSPMLVSDAIREIGLPEPAEPGPLDRLKDSLASLVGLGAEEPEGDPLAKAVLATLPMLQASPVVGTDIVSIALRTFDPERGVRLLDALVARYQAYVRENETAAHREGLQVLRQRESELAAAIAEVSARYDAREAEIRSLGNGDDALAIGRTNLEEQARARADAQRRRVEIENELLALRERRDARVAPSREIQDELVRAEAALAELRARVSERHPDVVALEQRAAGLRDQVRQGTQTHIDDLDRQARAARRTEATLGELFEREWKKVKALEAERRALETLAAERARLEEQRAAVLALMGEKELSVLASQGGENSGTLVRVLEAPAVPPDAVWPLPIPVLGACGLVGTLGGLALALLAEWRRRSEPAAERNPFEDAPARMAQRRA
jgi:uncharacterized protein involved in exopolysaccharide biosynthesis